MYIFLLRIDIFMNINGNRLFTEFKGAITELT